MFILILNLHGPGFNCGKREELEAEEEPPGHTLDSTPGGLEANEFEGDSRGFQRVVRLDIHKNLVFVEAVTFNEGRGVL
jgi:hypothetical protein